MMQQPTHIPTPQPGPSHPAVQAYAQLATVHPQSATAASTSNQVQKSQPGSPVSSEDTRAHPSKKRKTPPTAPEVNSGDEGRTQHSPQPNPPPQPQLSHPPPPPHHPHHPHPQGQPMHPSFHFQVPPGYVPVMPVPVGAPVATQAQPPEVSSSPTPGQTASGGRILNNSKRAEQNRKAQRAFRERRDAHVKALESRSQLLDAALASVEEANRRWEESRALVESLRMENAQLRAALNAFQQAGAAVAQMQHQMAQSQQQAQQLQPQTQTPVPQPQAAQAPAPSATSEGTDENKDSGEQVAS
ncbi:hypothetical protein FRB99_006102 [Tulasnella sp. 403]|nr:hypothetical protein FRB99_006102 [Tulasnella sp. 403]